MTACKKRVTMKVTVSCPSWMTAAEARKEVRTLINQQCFYGHGHWGATYEEADEHNFRTVKVAAA